MFYVNYILTRKPWCTFMVLTMLLLGLAAGAGQLQLTTDFRTYFSSDNPQLAAFEKLEADFNKQDTLVFLLQLDNAQECSVQRCWNKLIP